MSHPIAIHSLCLSKNWGVNKSLGNQTGLWVLAQHWVVLGEVKRKDVRTILCLILAKWLQKSSLLITSQLHVHTVHIYEEKPCLRKCNFICGRRSRNWRWMHVSTSVMHVAMLNSRLHELVIWNNSCSSSLLMRLRLISNLCRTSYTSSISHNYECWNTWL